MCFEIIVKLFVCLKSERIKEGYKLICLEIFPAQVCNLNIEYLLVGYIRIECFVPKGVEPVYGVEARLIVLVKVKIPALGNNLKFGRKPTHAEVFFNHGVNSVNSASAVAACNEQAISV